MQKCLAMMSPLQYMARLDDATRLASKHELERKERAYLQLKYTLQPVDLSPRGIRVLDVAREDAADLLLEPVLREYNRLVAKSLSEESWHSTARRHVGAQAREHVCSKIHTHTHTHTHTRTCNDAYIHNTDMHACAISSNSDNECRQ